MNAIRSALAVDRVALCVLPTGAGKTACFSEIIRLALAKNPAVRVLVLLNNIDLIKQTAERLPAPVSIFAAGAGSKVQAHAGTTVASVASLVRADAQAFDLVIIDECHALSDDKESAYRKILANQKCMLIGFTATPYRASGLIYGDAKTFARVCFRLGLLDMIERGFLVRPSLKHTAEQFETSGLRTQMGDWNNADLAKLAADEAKVIKQINDALPKLEGRRSVIWPCVSIKHCELVASHLDSANVIHSKMDRDDRNEVMRAFRAGEFRHLVFVSVIKEGIDIPRIDAVVFMRPTKSPTLYVQVCGRALRPFEGKVNALILDYGQVVKNLGPLDNPRVSSGSRSKLIAKREQLEMKFCEKCLEYISREAKVCPSCGESQVRESTKSLTARAGLGSILSDEAKPVRSEVTGVRLSRHDSKSGNECLKVSYRCGWSEVNEFFVWSADYGRKRWASRAAEMHIKVKQSLSDQEREPVARLPKQIETIVDGTYTRVRKLIF